MNLPLQDMYKLFYGLYIHIILWIVLILIFSRTISAAQETPLLVPVSINALMVTLIDHSAHYIWDYGEMSRNISEQEWRTVEYYSIQLAAAGPLITLGGSGTLDNTWAMSPEWTQYSRAMSDAAMLALQAANNKDKGSLLKAGDAVVDSCEGCHQSFKPAVPTEGILHNPEYDFLYHLFE